VGQTSPDCGPCRMLTGQEWFKGVDPSGPISQMGTAGIGATQTRRPARTPASSAVPKVRIRLPPADSQSLSRSRFRRSRTPLFRAGLDSWLGDRVSRDAPGSPLRANRRQYLCRAIFQYRNADEVVHENAAPIPTKLGLLRGERARIFEFGSGLSRTRSADRARQAADVSAQEASLPLNRAAAARRGSPP
jgi:hypothetical protein